MEIVLENLLVFEEKEPGKQFLRRKTLTKLFLESAVSPSHKAFQELIVDLGNEKAFQELILFCTEAYSMKNLAIMIVSTSGMYFSLVTKHPFQDGGFFYAFIHALYVLQLHQTK